MGFVEKGSQLRADRIDFGAPGGSNENYYDGDFGDFDGDGRIDRALLSRYGLLFNTGGGALLPVSTQVVGMPPNSRPSLTGFIFGDEVSIGNDAVQWADVDGDGDLDNVMGGNGEQFALQVNQRGRFSLKWKKSGSALNIVNIDVDRDGDVDFVAAHAFCDEPTCGHGCPDPMSCTTGGWPKELHLWINDGKGNFTDETAARGLGGLGDQLIVGLVAGDVDGDRDFDVVMLKHSGILVGRNDGTGSFSLTPYAFAVTIRPIGPVTSGFSQGMNLGDIDADGDLDLVAALRRDEVAYPKVGHAIFINDGKGSFVEDATRWDSAGYPDWLQGGNGKLLDLDYDGDLDFAAVNLDGNHLQIFLNDGAGKLRYDAARSIIFMSEPIKLGNDTDVTDLDGDGAYDIWLGNASQKPKILVNTHVDSSGLPADLPRNLRVVSAATGGIRLSWNAPPFAATARHYKVYRTTASGLASDDRRLLRVVANSVHEDEGFSAPITRFTTTAYLGDPDVTLDGSKDEIQFLDRTAEAGVTYYYAVSHIGTENTESRQTAEVMATVAPVGGIDGTAPALDIVGPTSQEWGASPRIVVAYGDGGSGVDPSTVSVKLDQALGAGRPAGAELADLAVRKDATAFVAPIKPPLELPIGLTTLTVRVADKAGNVAMRQVKFYVALAAARRPTASFTSTGGAMATIALSGDASSDADGAVMRWDWYFHDGLTAQGRNVTRTYPAAGTYPVTLVVRDNEGGVDATTSMITVTGAAPADGGAGDVGGGSPDGGAGDADAGGGPDGGAGTEGGGGDGPATPPGDGGSAADGGQGQTSDGGGRPAAGGGGGCGCGLGRGSTSGPTLIWVLAAALAAARSVGRRHRRSAGGSAGIRPERSPTGA